MYRDFNLSQLAQIPADTAAYAQKTYVGSALGIKWLPAGLVALIFDITHIFEELFWVVILLWFCDFAIGFLKAWHNPKTDVEWGKVFRSVLKLVVIVLGVVAVHLIEHLLGANGIATQEKLTGAALIVIGFGEAVSIMDNLCYFFPQMKTLAEKIKDLLGKARNGG